MRADSTRLRPVAGGGSPPPATHRAVPGPAERADPTAAGADRCSPLARLCGPRRADFADRYWGREPLLVEGADDRAFADLLDLDGVDELLSRRGLRTPFLRLARDGSLIGSASFTGPGGAGAEIGDQVRDDRVAALFGEGATIVLQALHRTWSPIIDLATGLNAELGHPVQVNAYVTPPDGQGFAAHYDVHDVFVLQLAGSKGWTVHAPVHPDPLRGQPWTDHADAVARRAREQPAIRAVLRPGDVMYLPRGWLHSATAQGDASAHLTVGIHVVTHHALLEGLLAALADDPRLRASLPPGLDPADPAQLAPHIRTVRDVVRDALDAIDPAAVAAHLRGAVWNGARPEPVRPLAHAAFAGRVGVGDAVRVRRGLGHRLSPAGPGQEVRLDLPDRRISLPGSTAAAVQALLTGQVCVVGDLPGLDEADQVVLVRRLVREAVVVPVARGDRGAR